MWRKIKISVQDKTKCRKARKSELNLKSDIGWFTPREATHHLNENNDNWLYFQNNKKLAWKKRKWKWNLNLMLIFWGGIWEDSVEKDCWRGEAKRENLWVFFMKFDILVQALISSLLWLLSITIRWTAPTFCFVSQTVSLSGCFVISVH